MAKFKLNDRIYSCPVELTLAAVGGKWKVLLLWNMRDGMRRYGELKRLIPGITHKMLTQQLRELEDDGIISRRVYEVVPPHVEYSLTERGKELSPVLEMMSKWGLQFMAEDDEAYQSAPCCGEKIMA